MRRTLTSGLALALLVAAAPHAMSAQEAPAVAASTSPARATGTFDVTVSPLASVEEPAGLTRGRSSIVKRFHGDLDGTAEGEMLTALTSVSGSAVYVAVERVTGTLHGRSGSFMLHHRGIMNRGAQQLAIDVVPDSGTGELVGLAGTMTISIADGRHSYEFEYTLP